MRWLREFWRCFGFEEAVARLRKQKDFRHYVRLFVLLVLIVPLAAEPIFELAKLAWRWIASAGWMVPIEPSLRAVALIMAGVVTVITLTLLVDAVRRAVGAGQKQHKPRVDAPAERLKGSIWTVVALLLTESILGEILVTAGGAFPVAGAWRSGLLIVVFVALLLVLVVFAAATLRNVEELSGIRLVNRIRQAVDRPTSWPAEVVICALSVPAKGLIEKDYEKLRVYERYGGADVGSRFALFADPGKTAGQLGRRPDNAQSFVESFNWRQIALAYHEQMKAPYETRTLPRLILLCSTSSREHVEKFTEFFSWLLEPLQAADSGSAPLHNLAVHDKDVDFEDLDSITPVLREVYNEQCKQHGTGKVIIDITGAQRPWALAALEATLDTEPRQHCTFSYVAQEPFIRDKKRSWVRYYDIKMDKETVENPAAAQTGLG